MINAILKKILQQWQLIVIAILCIVCFSSIRSCNVNADRADVAITKQDSSYLVANYYKNKSGDLVGQVKTHELTVAQLKEFGGQLGFELDGTRVENVKLKNLVAHWKGKAGMRDTAITVLHDTTYVDRVTGGLIRGKSFKWNNKNLFLDGLIEPNDTIRIGYEYNVHFSLTAYRKPQKGFWKPPGQLVTDIKFDDQNFKVTEFKGFVIVEPRKKWHQTNGFKYGAGFVLGGYAATRVLQR